MRRASNPYTCRSEGSKQIPSGLGEKIKGNVGANAGDRSSIAVARPLRFISRAVGRRILIKKDIPGRAGADRPSKQQLLKMNKCGRPSVSLRMAGGWPGRGGTDSVRPEHRFAWTGAGSQQSPEIRGETDRFPPTSQWEEGGGHGPAACLPQSPRVAGCPQGQSALCRLLPGPVDPHPWQLMDSSGRKVSQRWLSAVWKPLKGSLCWASYSAGISFLIVT